MANNGREAVELVERQPFDLVLMDVQMPVLDGTGATRAIRALEGPVSKIPIVAITANALRGDMETYLAAARQSRAQNITLFDEPVQKIVCVMQGDEFFSTWVANKAVYRTRMALADQGELRIIAPGLKRFGEQPEVDALIRKYGYCGTPRVRELLRDHARRQVKGVLFVQGVQQGAGVLGKIAVHGDLLEGGGKPAPHELPPQRRRMPSCMPEFDCRRETAFACAS